MKDRKVDGKENWEIGDTEKAEDVKVGTFVVVCMFCSMRYRRSHQ
jgi:hypothetical protein